MSDKKTETPVTKPAEAQDQGFVYGDAPAKTQIDAWEGENDTDFASDSGEMSLANLHFGSRPDAEHLTSKPAHEQTDGAHQATDKASDTGSTRVEVLENVEGAAVAALSFDAGDAGDTVTYVVSDERFEVVDGQVQLKDGISLDFEADATLQITVTAQTEDGTVSEEIIDIGVIDVNDAPQDLALDGNSVAENDAGAVIGTLSVFDPDGDQNIVYTLNDDRFVVVDGEVRLADGVSLDHEEAATIDLTVTATDSGGLSTTETFTIEVIDVNERPTDLALDGNVVAENDAGAVVGTLSSFDPDAGDTVTYTVSDDRFVVVDSEVRLADGVSLDHEEAASIDLTVTATDSGGLSTSETFTIDVTDVNERPTDLALDGTVVAENDAGAFVGTLSSFDPDAGDTVTYTVSDDRFEVVGNEVRLVDGVSLDHEEAASIDLTVTATDSGGLSTSETFTIDVTDVNERPTDLALDGNVVAENDAGAFVGTLSSFDPDAGDTVTYTVSDNRFVVVDGEVRLANGVSLDHEQAASIDLTVTATDSGGLSTSETFTIDVTDVNEGPSDLALDGNSVAENEAGAFVGTLSSFDPDAGDMVTYTVSDDRFEVVGDEVRLANGVSLNHEDAANIEFTVTATDSGGLSTEQSFTINVTDVNEGPSDLSLNGNTVAENDAGAFVGTLSSFNPDAGDTVTYTVSDDRFEVVGNEIRLVDGVSLDHEEAATIELTVTATDSGGLSTSETFTINVTDVNEGPSDISLSDMAVAENDAGAVIGTLSSYNPDADDAVTYTVSDGRFEIVDGEIRLVEGISLDHEEAATVELTVTATDSGGLSTEETFTINVTDVNEGPSNLALDGNTVAENSAGAVVGTLSSFDPDAGDTVTYTVSDSRFEVVDGELRLAEGESLSLDEAASIELTVTATDSGGLSTEETFTIDVTDVNESPTNLTIEPNSDNLIQGGSFEDFAVPEGDWRGFDGDPSGQWESENGIEIWDNLAGTAAADGNQFLELDYTSAADAISQTVNTEAGQTYTLSLDIRARGETTSDAIEIYWNGELVDVVDPSSTNWEEVSFEVVGTGGADVLEFREAEDGNDGLGAHLDNISLVEVPMTLVENDAGATVGTLSSFDPDIGDSVTYTVSDDRFEVVGDELRLVDGVSLDHEDAASIEVTVTATDSGGLQTSETFEIDVLDVNERPDDLSIAEGGSISETAVGGDVVARVAVSDPDAGDTHTFALLDEDGEPIEPGTGMFEIDPDTGEISLTPQTAGRIEPVGVTVEGGTAGNAEALIDGVTPDEGSQWQANTAYWGDYAGAGSIEGTSFTIDLGGLHQVEDLNLSVDNNDSYLIEYSVDGVNFETLTVISSSDGEINWGMDTISTIAGNEEYAANADFSAVNATHIRISAIDGDPGQSIGELEVIGHPVVDFDTEPNHQLNIAVTDNHGETYIETISVDVTQSETVPTIEVGQKTKTAAASVENGEITTGNGGGSQTSTVTFGEAITGAEEITIDFAQIDNSFEIEINGQSLTDEIIQLQSNVFNAETEVMLVFEDGTAAARPWVPTADGSPRFQVVITEDGVEIYGTRSPDSTELELMTLDGGEYNPIDLVAGDNSVTITNPDGSGPDGLSASVSGEHEVVVETRTITGTDGDDKISGNQSDEILIGGDGDDLFIYGENGGSDFIDGGEGWTDTIDLSGALADDAVYGQDWTVTVTEGEIISEDGDSIELSDDASGFITLESGETIEFANIEQIGF